MNPPPPITFRIAGVQHRPQTDIQQTIRSIVIDSPAITIVELVGEPSNKFDRSAVKVLLNDTHVGYIPKPLNVTIWNLRTVGWKPIATLVEYNPDAPTYEMFRVEVSFIKV